MKKRWIFVLAAAVMTLFVSYAYADDNVVSFTCSGSGEYRLSVINSGNTPPESDAYIAVKDADGALKSIKQVPIAWVNGRFLSGGTVELGKNDTVSAYV
ncbi:MAG: hypothetical protein PUF72_06555 [Clostridiales bacterium]|nr:hypothetical protein [Clostridiales bacterium]